MSAYTAILIIATVLDAGMKGVLLYALARFSSAVFLRSRPAWQAWLWIAVSLGFAILLVLGFVSGGAPWAYTVLSGIPQTATLVIAHAYVLGAVLLTGLTIRSMVRLWLVKQHLPQMGIGFDAIDLARSNQPRGGGLGPVLRLLRDVDVRAGESQSMPMSFGGLFPTIVVPCSVEGATFRCIVRSMVLHAFICVLRFDALWVFFSRLVQCVFFVNPCVWWAFGRYVRAREASCDQWTAYALGDSVAYADDLRRIAACRSVTSCMSIGTPMAFGRGMNPAVRVRQVMAFAGGQPDLIGRRRLTYLVVGSMLLPAMLGAMRVSADAGFSSIEVDVSRTALMLGIVWAGVAAFIPAVLGRRHRAGRHRTVPVATEATGAYRQTVAECIRAIEHDVQLCMGVASRVAGPVLVGVAILLLSLGVWQISDRIERKQTLVPAVSYQNVHDQP